MYPYPDPYVPMTTVAQEPPPGTWYYCASLREYYPYVTGCPEPWTPVAAHPTP